VGLTRVGGGARRRRLPLCSKFVPVCARRRPNGRVHAMRLLISIIVGLMFLIGQEITIHAAETPAGGAKVLLLQKHADKGLACTGCHQDNPPAKPAAMDKCLGCHGPYDKLADRTEGKNAQNPHASHQGELNCDSCHHVHKASVNYCSQCHQFEFNVP
jgi:hypothetical protein